MKLTAKLTWFALLIALLTAVAFAACGGESASPTKESPRSPPPLSRRRPAVKPKRRSHSLPHLRRPPPPSPSQRIRLRRMPPLLPPLRRPTRPSRIRPPLSQQRPPPPNPKTPTRRRGNRPPQTFLPPLSRRRTPRRRSHTLGQLNLRPRPRRFRRQRQLHSLRLRSSRHRNQRPRQPRNRRLLRTWPICLRSLAHWTGSQSAWNRIAEKRTWCWCSTGVSGELSAVRSSLSCKETTTPFPG